MKNVVFTVNGSSIAISSDMEVIEKCFEKAISIALNNKPISRNTSAAPEVSTKKAEKTAKFSKEDNIKLYSFLEKYGNYLINQFEITRGGKDNPLQYTVCTVFDNDQHRYVHYNPKGEDKFIATYSPAQVIENLNNNMEGFHLLHQVANGVQEKLNMINIQSNLESSPSNGEIDIVFKNYDTSLNVDVKPSKKIAAKA